MTVAECAGQMLEVEGERAEGVYGEGSLTVGVARVGSEEQRVVSGTLRELCAVDMGRPLHSLVLVGCRVHDLEREVLREWAVDGKTFGDAWEREYVK